MTRRCVCAQPRRDRTSQSPRSQVSGVQGGFGPAANCWIDAPYVISNNRSIHCLMMMMIQCSIPCQRQQASNLAINATAVVARVVVQALVVARHVIMIRHVKTVVAVENPRKRAPRPNRLRRFQLTQWHRRSLLLRPPFRPPFHLPFLRPLRRSADQLDDRNRQP